MGWYAIHWESPATGKWLGSDGGEFENDTAAGKWATGKLNEQAARGICKGTLFECVPGKPDRPVTELSGRG